MSFEKDMESPKGIFKWLVIIMVCLSALGAIGSVLGMFTSVATAPSRVITKTMQTENIIQSYEWFYDVNAAYDSRVSQIQTHRGIMGEETDKAERRHLRIELGAMEQTCRDLATKYNANSQKMNKQIFKGWTLPDILNMQSCT